jgi:multisubunit Na+/H+ antiporter MnhG subunit
VRRRVRAGGAAVDVGHASEAAALTAVLQMLATPLSGHLIGRAVYRNREIAARLDVVGELGGADAMTDRAYPSPE